MNKSDKIKRYDQPIPENQKDAKDFFNKGMLSLIFNRKCFNGSEKI